MGADEQFGSLMQLRNTSKPIKIGLLKNINNFTRLASLAVRKDYSLKSPTQLSKPVSGQFEKDRYYDKTK